MEAWCEQQETHVHTHAGGDPARSNPSQVVRLSDNAAARTARHACVSASAGVSPMRQALASTA